MPTVHPTLSKLRDHDYALGGISRELALEATQLTGIDLWDLFALANRVRHEQVGDTVLLCGIVNAKSGHCPEDCKFCAQSRYYTTGIQTYPLLDPVEMQVAAQRSADEGAGRFGIVTATKSLTRGKFLDQVLDAVRRIKAEGRVQPDASLGIIYDPEIAVMLKEAGLGEFNHNLETSRRYYPEVCSTHSYDERVNTIRYIKQAGIAVCSGGIFGMGETWEDRIDLGLELRDLDVDTVPMNFLHRIDGTPLAKMEPMEPLDILHCIALFRLLLPGKEIKVAGGREVNLRSLQPLMFAAGANSTMVGNYLTTRGWSAEKDHEMIRDLGLLSENRHDLPAPRGAVA
jgi:biotin synthase